MQVPELMEKVSSMASQGGGRMTVSLHPPELGRVEIDVSSRGGRVEIDLRSENDMAKAVLESALGDLTQSLQLQDLNVTRLEVHSGFQLDSDSMNHGYRNSTTTGEQPGWRSGTSHGDSYRGSYSVGESSISAREGHVPKVGRWGYATAATGIDLRV
jgi:flagellar hook-length control protein FliK